MFLESYLRQLRVGVFARGGALPPGIGDVQSLIGEANSRFTEFAPMTSHFARESTLSRPGNSILCLAEEEIYCQSEA